jgi:hypothetical protein
VNARIPAHQNGALMLVSQSVSEYRPPDSPLIRIRQAIALPIYTVALILDFASAALGRLAAWIAGDVWPG